MSKTYALVATRKQTVEVPGADPVEFSKDQVINTIVWDGVAEYPVGSYQRLDEVLPGWGVVGGKLVEVPPIEVADEVPPPRTCTPREFMDRFEDGEEEAIFAAAVQQPRLLRFVTRLAATSVVELDHPELIAGMDLLVGAALLTRARADEILAA